MPEVAQFSKTPCPYCGNRVPLVTGKEVYPHRPDLWDKPIWACLPCKAWAGCHPGGTRRVGRVANAADRALKIKAHAAFDPIWKAGRMSRGEAYSWLAKEIGVDKSDCHMGWLPNDKLNEVIRVCGEADK